MLEKNLPHIGFLDHYLQSDSEWLGRTQSQWQCTSGYSKVNFFGMIDVLD